MICPKIKRIDGGTFLIWAHRRSGAFYLTLTIWHFEVNLMVRTRYWRSYRWWIVALDHCAYPLQGSNTHNIPAVTSQGNTRLCLRLLGIPHSLRSWRFRVFSSSLGDRRTNLNRHSPAYCKLIDCILFNFNGKNNIIILSVCLSACSRVAISKFKESMIPWHWGEGTPVFAVSSQSIVQTIIATHSKSFASVSISGLLIEAHVERKQVKCKAVDTLPIMGIFYLQFVVVTMLRKTNKTATQGKFITPTSKSENNWIPQTA